MANTLTISQLREALRLPRQSGVEPFALLKAVSTLVNTDDGSDTAREMVLRALDQQDFFNPYQRILDALTRAVGLFPYINPDSLGLKDSIAYEFHRPLNMPPELVFHREQAKIYQRLLAGDSVVLSAPTSFGKSKIIDAMIASGRFENIAIIVPTLALIDETRRRLAVFSTEYKVVTHLSQPPGRTNIFVLTAERAIAYEQLPKIDFFVIDEFYKLDPGDRDDPRAVTLSQAFYKLSKGGAQFYLLGPNIDQVPRNVEGAYGCFFYQTRFGTVVSEQTRIHDDDSDEMDRLIGLAVDLEDPTLVFCSSPPRVNTVARTFVERGLGEYVPAMQACADWAGRTHHPDWIFCKAIVRGIGIHHGRLPRALAQYVVRAFNEGKLRYLICTSTLIEGVNTKAKNVVIFDNQIARQKIDYFTFNNIKGRSGRMGQHFVGHVYLFHEPPQQSLPFVDFPMLTQPTTTPTSLLVQMDEEDLTPDSQARVREFLDEKDLPIEIVRQNAGIDPAHQVELARYIRENAGRLWPFLSWTAAPNSKQFRMTCELIWTHLVRRGRQSGVSSGAQLSFKTFQLLMNRSVSVRVREELKPSQYAATTADEAVERVLEFDRNWATFELPRLLMALSRIQAHVLAEERLPHGDYQSFAARIECLFTTPVVAALDEYGIPIQLGERLQRLLGTADDLDRALAVIAKLNVPSLQGVNEFERELLLYAQDAI